MCLSAVQWVSSGRFCSSSAAQIVCKHSSTKDPEVSVLLWSALTPTSSFSLTRRCGFTEERKTESIRTETVKSQSHPVKSPPVIRSWCSTGGGERSRWWAAGSNRYTACTCYWFKRRYLLSVVWCRFRFLLFFLFLFACENRRSSLNQTVVLFKSEQAETWNYSFKYLKTMSSLSLMV